MKVLVTGAAGFIGAALAQQMLARGDEVVGIDNLNEYYDPKLKRARLGLLARSDRFRFLQVDIVNRRDVSELFAANRFDAVVHLAAQAGVRYSVEHPAAYIDANLVGFGNVLEGARHSSVSHFVFASSSSVYGANTRLPFSERDNVDHPLSLYAATKKANELMAHSYAHLFSLPVSGLRFFTVYGPWGRPDMALFKFSASMLAGKPIPVFNRGDMIRDFTYVDDIVEGVIRVVDRPAAANASWSGDAPDPATSQAPYRIYNIGNSRAVSLMRYIEVLEQSLGVKAQLELLPMQPGEVRATMADVSLLEQTIGHKPATAIEVGVARFAAWYKKYYGVPS